MCCKKRSYKISKICRATDFTVYWMLCNRPNNPRQHHLRKRKKAPSRRCRMHPNPSDSGCKESTERLAFTSTRIRSQAAGEGGHTQIPSGCWSRRTADRAEDLTLGLRWEPMLRREGAEERIRKPSRRGRCYLEKWRYSHQNSGVLWRQRRPPADGNTCRRRVTADED